MGIYRHGATRRILVHVVRNTRQRRRTHIHVHRACIMHSRADIKYHRLPLRGLRRAGVRLLRMVCHLHHHHRNRLYKTIQPKHRQTIIRLYGLWVIDNHMRGNALLGSIPTRLNPCASRCMCCIRTHVTAIIE